MKKDTQPDPTLNSMDNESGRFKPTDVIIETPEVIPESKTDDQIKEAEPTIAEDDVPEYENYVFLMPPSADDEEVISDQTQKVTDQTEDRRIEEARKADQRL